MVLSITGVQVRETVPDWVMQRVNEIVLADLTPEALQTRMRRGDIYPLERTERALGHFFRPGNLIALRERIAVCVSSSPAAQYLIARAARMAQRIKAELYVLYIDIGTDTHPEDQRSLAQNLRFAENLGAELIRAKGKSVAEEVAKVVREKHITQVVFGRSGVSILPCK
jgi:two-component system, OmpR family, sensor histidine kinase KdpD